MDVPVGQMGDEGSSPKAQVHGLKAEWGLFIAAPLQEINLLSLCGEGEHVSTPHPLLRYL